MRTTIVPLCASLGMLTPATYLLPHRSTCYPIIHDRGEHCTEVPVRVAYSTTGAIAGRWALAEDGARLSHSQSLRYRYHGEDAHVELLVLELRELLEHVPYPSGVSLPYAR
jgi:hypothetical protein